MELFAFLTGDLAFKLSFFGGFRLRGFRLLCLLGISVIVSGWGVGFSGAATSDFGFRVKV